MILKMQLIASVHKSLIENVEHAQRKQKNVYVARKGLQTFEGFAKNSKVKMHRLGKKILLFSNWEGPYIFIDYKDGKGSQKQDHGSKYAFSNISRGTVGNGQEGICNYIWL